MAADIITYVSRDLRSPDGGFYSAEDADSLPTRGSTVKKEGAFYTWTAAQIEEALGKEDADMFGYHFGVQLSGNCDPKHDIQGELVGQVSSRCVFSGRVVWILRVALENVLYTAHTVDETAKKFSLSEEEVYGILNRSLGKLKEVRDRDRPRPHLDDKILTSWNGLMVSVLRLLVTPADVDPVFCGCRYQDLRKLLSGLTEATT